MNSDFICVIGLMSGTSLDGLDMVYVKFDKNNYRDFKILHAQTKPYTLDWKQRLFNGVFNSDTQLLELDKDYGRLLGDNVNEFISVNNISEIDFIASHGHTILHQPDNGITLQVGNGQILSNETNQKVICDFRIQDVKLGGQGAPLVPIGDELLFRDYDACLNLGGFANVSFNENNQRIAFDVCPVNIVMNHYVQKLGLEYDNKGQMAREGLVSESLLDELNSLKFYKYAHPKSLGLEWVQQNVFPIINSYSLNVKDILRTFVEHVVIQLVTVLKNKKNVLITGGGAYNDFLIESLTKKILVEIVVPNSQLVEYKEALIFAFLGLLRTGNQVNCLKSVTGAKRNHSSGQIFNPKKS